MPHVFPLKPIDSDGYTLAIGSLVKVLSVESCAFGLPLEDQDRLRGIVGSTRQVVKFDTAGFVWLCSELSSETDGDFCLFPTELSLAQAIT